LKILAVVCPNGLGHYRRTVGILRRVAKRVPARISLACERWQFERCRNSEPSEWHRSVDYIFDVMAPGVHWPFELMRGRVADPDLSTVILTGSAGTLIGGSTRT
jgi:hypothetical protein